MADRPQTLYTSVDGADVAYQVMGDGLRDLLFCFGQPSNIDFLHEFAQYREVFRRLASFSRFVLFDRRGAGASDRMTYDAITTWEDWTNDIEAVLDAVGSERTAIFAGIDGGPTAMLYAALHPERVDALILVNTTARLRIADDYPIGLSDETIDMVVEVARTKWGTADFLRMLSPSPSIDDATYERLAQMQRSTATPRAGAAHLEYMCRNVDARPALGLIQAPTLVLHARDARFVSIEQGRYLAEHIEGARLIELPGANVGIMDPIVSDEVEAFLTGIRPSGNPERMLTTVLFSDIVESTDRAAAVGDRRWETILDAHDRAVREELSRYAGREVKTTGDGFVASFDRPTKAIRCAQAMIDATSALGISVRTGLHTGECELRGDDLGGLAVHIAARIGALAGAGEVLVSSTVKDLVIGSGIEFADRGECELKGVPGSWRLFAAAT